MAHALVRVAIASVIVSLIGGLIWLLLPPFFSPNTQVVLLRGNGSRSIDLPIIRFAEQDFDDLRSNEQWSSADWSTLLSSKESASRLGKRLEQLSLRPSDRLVLCIAVPGMTVNGEAAIACDDFSQERPQSGSVSISELLAQVSRSRAGEKFLVFYGRSIEYSPSMGIISDSFVRQVAQAVRQTNDPSLWVYCSHSSHQASHVETAAERSVFGMFFAAAAEGAADRDNDGLLTIGELTNFTTSNVAKWVSSASGNKQSQTPQLIWGGGEKILKDPALLATSDTNAEREWSPTQLLGNSFQDHRDRSLGSLAMSNANSSPGISRRVDVSLVSATGSNAPRRKPSQDASVQAKQSADDQDNASASDRSQQINLLAKAWRLAEPGENADAVFLNEVENRPHLLHELQQELLSLEQQLFFGSETQRQAAASRVTSLVTASQIQGNENADTPSLARLLGPVQTGSTGLTTIETDRLGLALAIAAVEGKKALVDVHSLEQAIRWKDRSLLDEWMKAKWKTEYGKYLELRWIRWLCEHPSLQWETVQVTSLAMLIGERAAAQDFVRNQWGRQLVEQADARRSFAARLLRSNRGVNSQDRVRVLLNSAISLYRQSLSRNQEAREASQTLELALYRLPLYLRTLDPATASDERFARLQTLTEAAKQLARTIREPASVSIQELKDAAARVQDDLDGLDAFFGEDAALRLLQGPPNIGIARSAWRLLRSPLLLAKTRLRLYGLIDQTSITNVRSFDLADLDSSPMVAHDAANMDMVMMRASLLFNYVSIGLELHGDDPPSAFAGVIDDMGKQLGELRAAMDSDESSSVDESRIVALQQFEQSVRLYYDALVEILSTETKRRSGRVDKAIALRMIAPGEAWRFAKVDIRSLSLNDRLQSTMLWQQRRQWQQNSFEHSQEWDTPFRKMRRQLPANVNTTIPQIKIDKTIDLQSQTHDRSTWEITNPGDSPMSLVLSADFDRTSVSLEVSRTNEDDGSTKPIVWQPQSTVFGTRQTVPVELKPRETVALSIKASRIGNATSTIPVTMDWFAPNENARGIDPTMLLESRRLDVELPVSELVIANGNRRTQSSGDSLTVLSYPNRVENLTFGVIAHDGIQKDIELTCYPLTRPFESEDWQTGWRQFVGEKLFTSTIKLDGRSVPVFGGPPAKVEKKKDPQPKATSPAVPITHGLIAVLRDVQTGQKTFRRIRFAVQRPRRYLELDVAFDRGRNQIIVDATASDPHELPSDGPIKINCRIADAPEQLRGKLSGVITQSHPSDRMFIELPTLATKTARLFVDVDDFPRAFVFDIDCVPGGAVTERVDLMEMQLRSETGRRILPASERLLVTAKLNMPVGRFEDGTDFVEVGLDLNHDGIPDPESRIRSMTDRQVQVFAMKATPDGRLTMKADVTDFHFELPASRLENLTVDVAARVLVDSVSHTYNTLPLYIDAEAPIVGPVQPSNPEMLPIAGKAYQLTAWSFDRGSGVQRIEAAFDLDGSGSFPKSGPKFTAIRNSPRKWSLNIKLPADVKTQTLLVRSIDEVGNTGEPFPVRIDVSAAGKTIAKLAATVALRGIVEFHGKPVPNAEVTLSGESSAGKPQQVRSSAAGIYQIAGIKPGKYTLNVRAIIRNRVHLFEQPLEIKPNPTTVVQDVKLP